MMNNTYWGGMHAGYGLDAWVPAVVFPMMFVVIAWVFFWKGMALWHSAKRGEKGWFIALLFINTLGILEIIYLFGVAKKKFSDLW